VKVALAGPFTDLALLAALVAPALAAVAVDWVLRRGSGPRRQEAHDRELDH